MQTWVFFILLILGIWLVAVSAVLYRIFALFNKLSRGVEVTDIKKLLEKLIDEGRVNKKEIGDLEKRINWLEDNGRSHVQKVGLIRFNPFRELGGDHSFCLAMLDADNSGVVITCLHTRDRTRVYMKDIKKGKSSFELSNEEKKVLAIAEKNK